MPSPILPEKQLAPTNTVQERAIPFTHESVPVHPTKEKGHDITDAWVMGSLIVASMVTNAGLRSTGSKLKAVGAEGKQRVKSAGETARDMTHVLAAGGTAVRGWVADKHEQHTEKRTEKANNRTAVRVEIAESVLHQRLPSPDLAPASRKEERLALRAARKRTKIMKKASEKGRLKALYGSIDAYGRPFLEKDASGKIIKDERGWPNPIANDLATPEQTVRLSEGRYSRRRIRQEHRVARQYKRAEKSEQRRHRRLVKPIVDARRAGTLRPTTWTENGHEYMIVQSHPHEETGQYLIGHRDEATGKIKYEYVALKTLLKRISESS